MNEALYGEIKVNFGSKYLILTKIPQVFASFFDSSAMWYFLARCSSKKSPRSLMYFTLEICFLPILITISVGAADKISVEIIELLDSYITPWGSSFYTLFRKSTWKYNWGFIVLDLSPWYRDTNALWWVLYDLPFQGSVWCICMSLCSRMWSSGYKGCDKQ